MGINEDRNTKTNAINNKEKKNTKKEERYCKFCSRTADKYCARRRKYSEFRANRRLKLSTWQDLKVGVESFLKEAASSSHQRTGRQ